MKWHCSDIYLISEWRITCFHFIFIGKSGKNKTKQQFGRFQDAKYLLTETQTNEILWPPPAAERRHTHRRFSVRRHKQWTGSDWDTLGLYSERVIHSWWSVWLNEELDNDHIISFRPAAAARSGNSWSCQRGTTLTDVALVRSVKWAVRFL